MATKKIKTQAQACVPADRDACAAQITEIGRLQREHEVMSAQMNDAIAQITDKFAPELSARSLRIKELSAGVQTWCEANRPALTDNNKVKYHDFLTGQVNWRTGLASVRVTGADAVIKTLKALGLVEFVRTKEEVDKEAILANASAAEKLTATAVAAEPDPDKRAAFERTLLAREMLQGLSGLKVAPGDESFAITPLQLEQSEVPA